MVVGIFPIAKLGTLLIRQISKPLAIFVKERAKSSQFFRTYICMPPAQFYNWCEVKAKMWIMDLGKPVTIPSLNEAMAIELGANLLGEAIIFAIAAGVLYAEYARSVRKELAKEEARAEEIENLQYTIQELYFQAERQDTQLRELMRTVTELHSQAVTKPWGKTPKPSPSGDHPPPPPPPFNSLPPKANRPVIQKDAQLKSPGSSSSFAERDREGGVIMKALAYLQISDVIGRTQDYSSTVRFS